MKVIGKLFSKTTTQNDALKIEYEELMIKANEYERQLSELIHQKVTMQWELSSMQKQKQKRELNSICLQCQKMNQEANEIMNQKQLMLEEFKEIKDNLQKHMNSVSIIDTNTPMPNIEKYFIMNDEYYVLDKDNTMYNLTLCNKYQEYKHTVKDEDVKNKSLIDYIKKVYNN